MELGWSPGRLCGATAYRKADARARAPEPLRNIATARPSACDRLERLSRKSQLRDLRPRRRGALDFAARKRRGLVHFRKKRKGPVMRRAQQVVIAAAAALAASLGLVAGAAVA